MAQVVYARAAPDTDIRGDLFGGLKFFIAQRCPSRTTYVDKVISNGGQVVKLETQADLLIADDIARKTHLNPVGAISYKFIDDSLRRGTLADAEDEKYRAGPAAGSVRPVGSVQPGRFGRTPFTLEDKIQLYEFVQSYAEKGGSVRGNEIYKQLERINNRHTYQAWRDHYIKQLEGRPHPGNGNVTVQQTAPPTPPVDPRPDPLQDASEESLYEAPPPRRPLPMTTAQARRYRQDPVPAQPLQPALKAPGFTAVDIHDLLINAEDILDTRVRHEAAAWQAWVNLVAETADPNTKQKTPNEWKLFWQRVVHPLYKGYEDDARRTKIYNTSWLAWSNLNQDATADEWLEYYELVVMPLLESDEQGPGTTPVKKGSSQIFGGHASSPVGKVGRAAASGASGPSGKRSSQEDLDHHGMQDGTARKRQRLHVSETSGPIPTHAAGPEDLDADAEADASMRAFVNISDDEFPRPTDGKQQNTPTPAQTMAGHSLPSSPPPTTGSGKRKPNTVQDTQAILEQSQMIDFDIPEPEGGFDNDALYPDLRAHDSLTSSQADPLGHELATMATVQTHSVENGNSTFDMPEPEPVTAGAVRDESTTGFVTAPSRSTSALAHHAAAAAHYRPLEERAAMLNIEALVDSGRDPSMIQEAALRTSADPKLFRIVLRSLEHGRGVPKGMRGVWTHEDDEVVQGTDARGLQRLEAKHGSGGLHSVEGRLEFLREWTDA